MYAIRNALQRVNMINGVLCRPVGKATKLSRAVSEWYDSLTHDTVAVAHGGTARGLLVHLGIAKPAAAPLVDIAQGVVYVFEGKRMTRLD